jgi:hypothetical protein
MASKSKLSKGRKKSKDKQRGSGALPGWPGYRTREGRSGYDPIDTRTEAAHTAGTIIQKLFTGQTRNPISLFVLGVLGLALITPLILGILEAMGGNQLPWNAWLFLVITGIVGLAILINFIRNLIESLIR